ncbi:LpqB family beta-propeller domain-containing protein [Streptomyces sp. B-S-A8]|uniref:LpqB family beta-propeller domain-containing protein n=1 Tax=Streptomyces solicavernae TaxID=3043614 RepID=A0ABT6S0D6_9ACTN|nr:LpqB family beta-propeller domain-containing protein [Streptomyces sp. B-S-A8]MDI3389438.1 LpqB family beta-propeller domain-containing protein [Streptomyces sp. B-S-A8]
MPDSGGVEQVDASPQEPRVQVFAVPPQEGASPSEIVEGFLEALTSDDPEFATARKYLTKEASERWEPKRSTTVLADGPNADSTRTRTDPDGSGYTYALTGRMIATVDDEHAYRSEQGKYSSLVHLVRQNGDGNGDGDSGGDGGEWRIDVPPSGVVLAQADFERLYLPVSKYFYASPSSSDGGYAQSSPAMVADPVYIRKRIDPVTQAVRALLDGPTNWLDNVVDSRFPSGIALKKGTKSLAPDDQNRLKVPLNERADAVKPDRCAKMAAQLFFTLRDLPAAGIEQVELQRANGTKLCALDSDQAEASAPNRALSGADYQYFIDDKHRLVRMPKNGDEVEPAPGPLGSGERQLRSAAVSRAEDRAAGVSNDGRSLYVGSLLSDERLEKTKVRSEAKQEKDRLTKPSWDGRGDLWVADRDPRDQRLLWLAQGGGKPVEVKVVGLDDARINAVRVSADGVRVALIVERDGRTELKIGRVERQGTSEDPEVSVVELRPGAPQMEEVTAMSWAGGSRLVVVGKEAGGVQQLQYVQSDGSVVQDAALPALTGVTDIAASEDERLPLVARSEEDGIVRLPPGASWRPVVKDGTSPVYPG